MRMRLLLAAILLALAPGLFAQSYAWPPSHGHITLQLWPHGAPGEPSNLPPEANTTTPKDGLVAGRTVYRLGHVSDPTLTLYKAKHNSGAAVLVFPGGSYQVLAIDLEGTEVCQWLNSINVNCILVKYRVPNTGPYPKSVAALQDAQRAMGLVREHAAAWHIDSHRIGVLGFSAGAHLSAALSTHFDQRLYTPIDAADQRSCRPDFQMLIYPGWLALAEKHMEPNPSLPVTSGTPTAFLVQAEDDPVHVENVIEYFLALKHAGVPAEMHVYAQGGHGYGLRPTPVSVSIHDVPRSHTTPLPITHWPQLATTWLHTIGVLN